ncbi:MAG: TetR/AcrR family transcriptional regulator [Rhodocyclaceae bacterium]|nr:TetR/AcrR family transcriptional regulator [Rhodocyclaceae bacterium]
MTLGKQMKSGRPTESIGQVKKDLLAVTIHLLNTRGRKGATARAICTEAGVGAPVIYHHYGDLEGLYRAAIDESFSQVAKCYKRSAKAKGPVQGIRDSWALFMHFAYEQPRMCRIVVEQIIAGQPPRSIASTLQNIARDIASLDAEGRLNYSPEAVSQMLWVGALGSVGFISTEREENTVADPAIQESVLNAILNALFTDPKPEKTERVQTRRTGA